MTASAVLARSYGEVVRRVRAAARSQCLGQVEGLPVLHARLGDPGGRQALLIGGTHGDEPAGVEALLRFLAGPPAAWLQRICFDVLPCTNPTGYQRGTRQNAAGADLNWSWQRQDLAEIPILEGFLAGRRYDFILDFHEDWESPGFYLYEHCRGVEPLGERIAQRVAAVCPLNLEAAIDGWPARGAVVSADTSPQRLERRDGIPIVLFRDHTDHKLTTESPTSRPLEQRVEAHAVALEVVVTRYLEQP